MSRAVAFLERKILSDAHFLYTAFAPVVGNTRDKSARKIQAQSILVKVGISTAPMKRIIAVHHGSPFRVAYAAFTALYAGKAKAERVESRILDHFREYRTRGEWLMLPNSDEMKGEFSARTRAIIAGETGRPVDWTRFTATDLAMQNPRIAAACR